MRGGKEKRAVANDGRFILVGISGVVFLLFLFLRVFLYLLARIGLTLMKQNNAHVVWRKCPSTRNIEKKSESLAQ